MSTLLLTVCTGDRATFCRSSISSTGFAHNQINVVQFIRNPWRDLVRRSMGGSRSAAQYRRDNGQPTQLTAAFLTHSMGGVDAGQAARATSLPRLPVR